MRTVSPLSHHFVPERMTDEGGSTLYRLLTYHWRANAIRKRGSGPYDDRLGAFRTRLHLSGCFYV